MVEKLLQNIINHSYDTVPYYRELFDKHKIKPEHIKKYEDLIKLPVLTKEMVQNEPDKFISEQFLYYPRNRELVIKRTSGSTGKFMKIYWSRHDDIRSLFHLWLVRKNVYGIEPTNKFCSFHTTIYANNKLVETPEIMFTASNRNLSFCKLNMNIESISKFYERILEFEPEWFFMQPSLAYLFAEYVAENKLPIPPTLRYIELNGEYLLSIYRNRIEEVFGLKTVNHYGCNEINGIGIECPYGNMHILNNNVIVEVLNNGDRVNDGEQGQIHITGLTNTAMPFIRYSLGDIGILYNNIECPCGNTNSVIKLLTGRINDFVVLGNGQKLNSYIFLYPIETVNSRMGNPILQFQIVQKGINKFVCSIALKKSYMNWKDSISNEFKDVCKSIGLNNVDWQFKFVECLLPDVNTGKLQFFRNETANEKEIIYV